MKRTIYYDLSYSRSLKAKTVFIYIVCILLSILSIFPFWIMFVNATRSSLQIKTSFSLLPSKYLIENWKTMINREAFNVFLGFKNSFFIATCSTILTVYFSALTAYGLAVYQFKLRKSAFTFIIAVLMVPTQVAAVGFYRLMASMNLNNTFIPLIVPAIAAPAVVFFMHQYIKSALLIEIVESARIDGAGEFYIFNWIALPIFKPAIATQAIFSYITSWNNFFMPGMILTDVKKYTLPLMVQILKSDRFRTDYGVVYLGLSLTVLPLIIVYLLLSKHIIRGVALGSVKG